MRYRYTLRRVWAPRKAECCFVMLNPSTADENANDPTVERCQRRAIAMGFGALNVVNIFALRSTDPGLLYRVDDPVGPHNDGAIVTTAIRSQMTICGWGTHGELHGRGGRVLAMLRAHGVAPMALRINANGTPAHPLYIPYTNRPIEVPT
jgi:hypothetical protein